MLLRRALPAIAICLLFATSNPTRAQETPAKPETTPPAKAERATPDQKEAAADLKAILERLNKLERELVELRAKSGTVPANKADQKLYVVVEEPRLSTFYIGNGNTRVFAGKLILMNQTDKPLTLKREDVELVVDGNVIPTKDVSPQIRHHGIQMGQQSMNVESLQLRKEIVVTPGSMASSWFVFTDLVAGNHIPHLILRLKTGTPPREVDINAIERDRLGITIERLGPRDSLGLVTISGSLNPISIGSFLDELDRLTSDKVARVVVRWTESASPLDPQVLSWIHQSAETSGQQQNQGEGVFPAVPVTIRELHLAKLPGEGADAYRQNSKRIHKTDAEAVIAALFSAYEVLPRDELFQAILSGSKLEKAAALAGGGGRLGADKLPLILKCVDDDDPMLQQAALAALSHFGEDEAIGKLIEYVRKNVAPLSETAISSLAGSRYSTAHQSLLEMLKNEPPESKKMIVKVLARHPRPIWSEVIYEFVKDSRAGLNIEALNALVQVGHPQLIAVLKDALGSKDAALQAQAFNVLSSRTDSESEELAINYALEELKKNPPPDHFYPLLMRIKDKRSLPLLLGWFDKVQNKQPLIQALAAMGDLETAAFLAEKYSKLQSHEKGEVIRVISRLDPTRFREMARQALLSGDGALMNYTVQGLQEDGGPQAIELMIEVLDKSDNSNTWSYLCNALAVVGTPAARAALYRARDSGNKEKRSYALNALTNMRQRSPGYQFIYQAQNFVRQRKFKEAIEYFSQAIMVDPELPEAYAERGNCYLSQEKFEEAAKDFEKCLEYDSWNIVAVTGSAIVMVVKDGKLKEAMQRLEQSRERFDDNSLYFYNSACVYGRCVDYLKKNEKVADRDMLIKEYGDKAIANLKDATAKGFSDFKWMKEDPDLKAIHDHPEFEKTATPPANAPPQDELEAKIQLQGQIRAFPARGVRRVIIKR